MSIKVGYLAQEPRYFDHMTACQTLRYTFRFFYSSPRGLIGGRIEEVFGMVGLEDNADRPIKSHSTNFQKESLRVIFPFANSSRSTPRTSMCCPDTEVPVSVHSETPKSPQTQC
jgi:hypothetical protein